MCDKGTNVPNKTDFISRKDAEAAMIALRQEDIEAFGIEIPECFPSGSAIGALNKIPAADVVEVVHGKWIKVPKTWHEYPFCKCPFCGKEFGFRSNFCPNCGADMREPNLDTTKGVDHD